MKATSYLRFAALAAWLPLAAIACSDANSVSTDGPRDASVPPEDGGTEDSGSSSDAWADADHAEQVPRTCTDEGWCHTVVPGGQTLRGVWGDGEGVVWTVSVEGNILRWDGAAWVSSYAAGAPLYAIWGSGPTDLWAGGDGGLFHGTGTSASTIAWTAVSTPEPIRSIWGASATDVWAVGYASAVADLISVFHYSGPAEDPGAGNFANGWEVDPVTTAFPTHFDVIWGTSRDDVWLAGRRVVGSQVRGQLLHRRPDEEGGFTWRTDSPLVGVAGGRSVYGNSFSRSDVLLSAVTNGNSRIFYTGLSNDDGATFTWTRYSASESRGHFTVAGGTGPNDIWIASEDGQLRHWDGNDWRFAAVALDNIMPVTNAMYAIWCSGPDDVWVVGDGIALRKIALSKL